MVDVLNVIKLMELQKSIYLLKCQTEISQQIHGIFQYGEYQNCLATPDYNYNLVWFGQGDKNTGIYLGLCLPDKCTPEIIKNLLQSLLGLMDNSLNIFGIDSDIQDYEYPSSFLFYFIVVLIVALLLLVFLATVNYKNGAEYLKSFSLQQSMKAMEMKDGSDLNVFNGIRSLSMVWVVLGHTFLNTLGGGVINLLQLPDIIKKPFFLIIEASFLSVDIFFFLGGFFLAFVFLRQKSKSLMKYPVAILQRALRIWPAYIMTMLVYYQIFMHLGGGPRWQTNEPAVALCSNMWRSLLFFDNFVDNGEAQCISWGWYLQVDFQIFLVCLLLLFCYSYKKILSFVFAGALLIGSQTFNLVFTQTHQQKLITDLDAIRAMRDYSSAIYIKPYGRWAPYIFGLFVGIAYVQYTAYQKDQTKETLLNLKLSNLKQKLEKSKFLRLLIEWAGMGLMAFLTFVPRELQKGAVWSQVWHSLYLTFSRLLFDVGILLVILPTLLGIKHSFFRTLLDTKLFNFIAKISFSVYLVHYIVLSQEIAYRAYDIYYDIQDTFIQFLGVLVLSCFFGFVLAVTVELPFSSLQKQLFSRIKKNNAKQGEKQKSAFSEPKQLQIATISQSISGDISLRQETSQVKQ